VESFWRRKRIEQMRIEEAEALEGLASDVAAHIAKMTPMIEALKEKQRIEPEIDGCDRNFLESLKVLW